MPNEEKFDIEADLKEFENRLKQLRAEYNQFFLGVRRELPHFTESVIKRIIRRYISESTLRGQQRFFYHDLVARYNTMREYWYRRLRTRDEGLKIGQPAHSHSPVDKAKAAAKRPARDTLRKMRERPRQIEDPRRQAQEVRQLYLDFIRAVREYQGEEGFLSLPKFTELIDQRTSQIKDRRNCEAVEYRIEIGDDGRVKLKAKPIREQQ